MFIIMLVSTLSLKTFNSEIWEIIISNYNRIAFFSPL